MKIIFKSSKIFVSLLILSIFFVGCNQSTKNSETENTQSTTSVNIETETKTPDTNKTKSTIFTFNS